MNLVSTPPNKNTQTLIFAVLDDPGQTWRPPKYSKSADDDVFIHLAKTYSFAHPEMHTGPRCANGYREPQGGFRDGITNGADWYAVKGTMIVISLLHSIQLAKGIF